MGFKNLFNSFFIPVIGVWEGLLSLHVWNIWSSIYISTCMYVELYVCITIYIYVYIYSRIAYTKIGNIYFCFTSAVWVICEVHCARPAVEIVVQIYSIFWCTYMRMPLHFLCVRVRVRVCVFTSACRMYSVLIDFYWFMEALFECCTVIWL